MAMICCAASTLLSLTLKRAPCMPFSGAYAGMDIWSNTQALSPMAPPANTTACWITVWVGTVSCSSNGALSRVLCLNSEFEVKAKWNSAVMVGINPCDARIPVSEKCVFATSHETGAL